VLIWGGLLCYNGYYKLYTILQAGLGSVYEKPARMADPLCAFHNSDFSDFGAARMAAATLTHAVLSYARMADCQTVMVPVDLVPCHAGM